MAKLKVIIVDSTTLKLDEDGKKGDIIDLKDVQSVDTTPILDAISKSTDKVYLKKLEEEISVHNAKKEAELSELRRKFQVDSQDIIAEKNKLQIQLDNHQKELQNQLDLLESKLDSKHQQERFKLESELNNKKIEEINKKQQEIDRLKIESNNLLEAHNREKQSLELKLQLSYQDKLNQNESKIKDLEALIEKLELNQKAIISEKENQFNLEIANIQLNHQELIQEKENELNQLKLQRSSLQVKMIGEDLEKWCNSEYEAYAIAGFSNCLWYKDTIPSKGTFEDKGTKADYIFEVYSGDNISESELLISVTCEMKSESPTSKTKQKNSDHFNKLNRDRTKNNSQYALLISELEWDTVNDVPIKKVQEYENMYVVRPAYFISFLSLIKSLADKYRDLLKASNEEGITFKESQMILDEFEAFKKTYLENPINALAKEVEQIKKEAQTIYEASHKIVAMSDNIISGRIEDIRVKIERFNINKVANRIKKLNKE